MGFFAGLGSVVRSVREGNIAANAVIICSELTGQPFAAFEIHAKQSAYLFGNKESLALSLLVSYCDDLEDYFTGELVRKLNPLVKDRILVFYKNCKENGLTSSLVDDEYSRFL